MKINTNEERLRMTEQQCIQFTEAMTNTLIESNDFGGSSLSQLEGASRR